MWVRSKDCEKIIRANWNTDFDIISNKLDQCKIRLLNWSKTTFGCLDKQIAEIKSAISKLQKGIITSEVKQKLIEYNSQLDSLLLLHYLKWKQRAKQHWYKKDDKNSRYFHAFATARKEINTISALRDNCDILKSETSKIENIIGNFFADIFSSSSPSQEDITHALSRVRTKVTAEMANSLTQPFADEVLRTLKHMHPFKSSGPDGMSPIFFQKFWHIVKHDVTNFVLNFLNHNSFLPSYNYTHIVLIPKVRNPEYVSQFRPISLCNVIYKITSKALSLRLRSILPSIISESQSVFVPGCLITDNVLVAYEIHHSMKSRRHSNTGHMSIKVDMSKAFDRVEWSFLIQVLAAFGFPSQFISLITTCISTSSFSSLLNGQQFGSLNPTRGIWQGDPLSSHLFILCLEVFSLILQDLQATGAIHGIAVNKNAPTISHLFFADDTLLFGHATVQEATTLQFAIGLYESASGQRINREKSGILFSPATPMGIRNRICCILNIPEVAGHGKYLGLAFVIGANKQQIFSDIIDRIWGKIHGWKEKYLSQAGRLTLIQAVIQSIPTYAMSCFKLPDNIIAKIQSMTARFLWSCDPGKNSLHWRRWDEICKNKKEGSLGLRNLKAFNMALLCKQAWRLLSCPSSLLARVFRAKYYPHSSLLDASLGNRPSWSWRSIFGNIALLKIGCRRQIRSGSSTSMWRDPRIPCHSDFRVHSPRPPDCSIHSVADLIAADLGIWKEDLIRDTFSEIEARSIMSIPLGSPHSPDIWCWHFSHHGKFSIRSAYHAILDKGLLLGLSFAQSSNGPSPVWKKLWKLRIPHRSILFIWRCLTQSVASQDNLLLHHVNSSDPCAICGHHSPSSSHIFFQCSFAEHSWKMAGLWEHIMKFAQPSFTQWLQDILLTLEPEICEIFAIMCDFIWYFRNKKKWDNVAVDPFITFMCSNTKLLDFRNAQAWPERPSPTLISHCLMEKIPSGPHIFFDGSISSSNCCAGTGVVIFESSRNFVFGFSRKFVGIQDAEVAEVLALK
ncbi:hypothetical protein DH2020_016780 [Rehmannia glutinosa]|uniref:Reverse transcriptase domain-containing protein n=1 Tax=Rehmannia glutinosa TaxID=99300 RepID=A0ABR0WPY5_REHGL